MTYLQDNSYINLSDLNDGEIEPLYHVVLPRNSRLTIEISMPSLVDESNLSRVFNDSIKKMSEDDDKKFIQYLGYKKLESDNSETSMYNMYICQISTDMSIQLKQNNINNFILYIGLLEDKNKVSVMDERPLEQYIAFYDRNGDLAPYETPKISIK